jgi:hypothetical protein
MKSFLALISPLLEARSDVFSHPVVQKGRFLAREQPKLMADYGRRVEIPPQVLWAQASPQSPSCELIPAAPAQPSLLGMMVTGFDNTDTMTTRAVGG